MENAALEFEDKLFDLLPDPDSVGTSEYSLLYGHMQDVVQSAAIGGDDVASLVLSSLDEVGEELLRFRAIAREAMGLEPIPRGLMEG